MTKKAQNNKSSVTGEFVNAKKGNNQNFNRAKLEKLNLRLNMQDYRRLFPYSIFDIEFTDKINSVHDEIRKRFSYLIFCDKVIQRWEKEEINNKSIFDQEVSFAGLLLDYVCSVYLFNERNGCYFDCERSLNCMGDFIERLFAFLDDSEFFEQVTQKGGSIAASFTSWSLQSFVEWATKHNNLEWLREMMLTELKRIIFKEEFEVTGKFLAEKNNTSKSFLLWEMSKKKMDTLDHTVPKKHNLNISHTKKQARQTLSDTLNVKASSSCIAAAKQFLNKYYFTDIYDQLDKYVCGQEEAKRSVAVLLRNHALAVANPGKELKNENLLLIGPSGCGKTELMRAARRFYPFPILEINCALSTPTGWVGASISSLIAQEIDSLDSEKMKLVRCPIVFIDESDKMFLSSSYDRDQMTVKQHQSNFLKMFESGKVSDDKGNLVLDGQHVSFILAGVFPDLFKDDSVHINKDLTRDAETNRSLTQELIHMGVEPEFLGRIADIAQLKQLDNKTIVNILKEYPSSTIKDAAKKYKLNGMRLEVTDEAYEELANYASESGMGLRGTSGLLHRTLQKHYFKPGTSRVVLTADMLKANM